MNAYQHVNEKRRAKGDVRKIFKLVKRDAEDYGNDKDFNPTFVLVVTYNRMHQYPFVSVYCSKYKRVCLFM